MQACQAHSRPQESLRALGEAGGSPGAHSSWTRSHQLERAGHLVRPSTASAQAQRGAHRTVRFPARTGATAPGSLAADPAAGHGEAAGWRQPGRLAEAWGLAEAPGAGPDHMKGPGARHPPAAWSWFLTPPAGLHPARHQVFEVPPSTPGLVIRRMFLGLLLQAG